MPLAVTHQDRWRKNRRAERSGRVGSRAHKEKEKVGVGNEGLQFEKIVGQ